MSALALAEIAAVVLAGLYWAVLRQYLPAIIAAVRTTGQ